MDDEFIIRVFPTAWDEVVRYIDKVTLTAGFGQRADRGKSVRNKNPTRDAVAVHVGINPRTFRDHLSDKNFVVSSIQKYHTDTRVAERVRLIVKFYWNVVAESVDARSLSAIFLAAMGSQGRSTQLEQYLGDHVFLHLSRKNALFEWPISIGKNDRREIVFVHRAEHRNSDDANSSIQLEYKGIVVPHNDGMILFSLGTNKATPYFRMFNANCVHNCRALVTYGIYSGRTTTDNRIFSARAALIPSDIWQTAGRSQDFRKVIMEALRNDSADNDGALVVPTLRTLYPE